MFYLPLVYLEEFVLRLKHYKMYTLFIATFALSDIIIWFLTGKYIGDYLEFYGKMILYLYFAAFSFFIGYIFYSVSGSIFDLFYRRRSFYGIIYHSYLKFIGSTIITTVVEFFIMRFPYVLLVFIFFSHNILRILMATLVGMLIIIPALAFSFAISPMLLIFKGSEATIVENLYDSIFYVMIPFQFAITILPHYNLLEIIVPTLAIMEESRKLLFLGSINTETLVISLITSLLYLGLGIAIFKKAYETVRRKGWIGLR